MQTLAPRGQDAAGVFTESMASPIYVQHPDELPALRETIQGVGHTLHAMVGCVPQPLVSDTGVLVANCELYTWRTLARESGLSARNDADLLLQLLDNLPSLDESVLSACIQQLPGTFAFAYERDGIVVVARDLFGVKPIWFNADTGLAIASSRRALRSAGIARSEELSPRSILVYERSSQTLRTVRIPFLSKPEVLSAATDVEEACEALERALEQSVLQRVPENSHTPAAVFLGGGVDSAALATILGSLPAAQKPIAYCVAIPNSREARAAKAVAAVAGLELVLIRPTPELVTRLLPRVLESCDDGNPVKVALGLVTAIASEAASQDGCLCAFTGTGVDEAFASLARAQRSSDQALEAIAALRKLHERELTRDDAIAMSFGVELRLPFLDAAVVRAALQLLGSSLDTPRGNKQPFRIAAERLGVPAVLTALPRKAPHYGSGVLAVLIRLAKQSRARSVSEFLSRQVFAHSATGTATEGQQSYSANASKRLAVLLSGGKDSILAAHIMHSMQYTLACAITVNSDNPDSYLYHTPNTAAAALQAQAMRLPFISVRTHGEPELELSALREALLQAKEAHNISGVVTGAIGSHYQRERIEQLCDELNLTSFSPLWQMDQVAELRLLLAQGFDVRFTRVAAEGLDASWLGAQLTEYRVQLLQQLHARYGVHPAGEGGEYESLVLDAPLFHEKLEIGRTEVIKDGSAATLHVHAVTLVPKRDSTRIETDSV